MPGGPRWTLEYSSLKQVDVDVTRTVALLRVLSIVFGSLVSYFRERKMYAEFEEKLL